MDDCAKACFHASLYALVIASVAVSGFMDSVTTEDGLEHYAEKPWTFLHSHVPMLEHVPMPLNTIVNVIYIVLGVYWIKKWMKTAKDNPGMFKEGDLYMQYVFQWMSILYGFVQLLRILTQNHRAAILDQWYTLPIFAWAACMSNHVENGWDLRYNLRLIRISTMSYGAALVHPLGFDVVLVLHIFWALYKVLSLVYSMQHHSWGVKLSFWKTFLALSGFVFLKLLDHYLPSFHEFFSYVTGHFLSKICDGLQFCFGAEFMYHVYRQRFQHSKDNLTKNHKYIR